MSKVALTNASAIPPAHNTNRSRDKYESLVEMIVNSTSTANSTDAVRARQRQNSFWLDYTLRSSKANHLNAL